MVYTYTGKNTYALSKALEAAALAFVNEHGALALERIDATEKDADVIIQAAQSMPFLADKKMVVIKGFVSNKELLERISELVKRTLDTVDVYLVDQTVDKRKTYYKELKNITKLMDFTDEKSHDLIHWIVEFVKDNEGEISRSDADFLFQRVGSDQQRLGKELEKLLLYNQKISLRSIELLTDPSLESSIFSLLDEAFKGNTKKAVELYRKQRAARVDTNYITAMLTWQLQSVALAVHAKPQTEAILIAAGQSPFSARKSLQLAKRINDSALKKYVVSLSEIDAKTKNSAVDADAALELYLLNLA